MVKFSLFLLLENYSRLTMEARKKNYDIHIGRKLCPGLKRIKWYRCHRTNTTTILALQDLYNVYITIQYLSFCPGFWKPWIPLQFAGDMELERHHSYFEKETDYLLWHTWIASYIFKILASLYYGKCYYANDLTYFYNRALYFAKQYYTSVLTCF